MVITGMQKDFKKKMNNFETTNDLILLSENEK